MLKKVKLNQLLPNPYRHFDTYPISRPKIEILKESMTATGFWGETVIARPAGKKLEIAFGHHRIEAAREVLGKNAEVQISVRKLSDTDMLAMMCRENHETYAVTADMDIEMVRAAIEGFAEGKIDLPAPTKSDRHGGARRYLCPADFGLEDHKLSSSSFTKDGLRDLVGMPVTRFDSALRNLKFIQKENLIDEESFQGLKADDAAALTRSVHAVKVKAGDKAAKRAGKKIAKKIKKDNETLPSGVHAGRKIAKEVEKEEIEKVVGKVMPDIDDYASRVNKALDNFLCGDKNAKDLDEIMQYADALGKNRKTFLIAALKGVEDRASAYRKALEKKPALRRVK